MLTSYFTDLFSYLYAALMHLLSQSPAIPIPNHQLQLQQSQPDCLQPAEGRTFAVAFQKLIRGDVPPSAADNLVSINVTCYSDSMNMLGGRPLGQPTYRGRDALKAELERHYYRHPTPVTLQAVDVVTCEGTVVLRWVAAFGAVGLPVRGIQILGLEWEEGDGAEGRWMIKTVRTEFNNLGYLVDLGVNYTMAPGI